ncbi:MAG: hypothetical protein KDD26_04735 [Winogradskyella sp.]|nr:hypothetical protein [Winogradskyella sp.]
MEFRSLDSRNSLFNQHTFRYSNKLTRENAFGFSPQIIGDDQYNLYTIKLFNEHKNEIVFEPEDASQVHKLGSELAILFNVELYNTLE